MHNLRLFGATLGVLAALTGTALAGAYDDLERWVNVHNISDETLWSVYLTDGGDHSVDLLNEYTVAAGDMTTVEPYIDRGYCMYDAKFVFESGAEVVLWNVNLCEAVDIYVDDWTAFVG